MGLIEALILFRENASIATEVNQRTSIQAWHVIEPHLDRQEKFKILKALENKRFDIRRQVFLRVFSKIETRLRHTRII